MYVTLIHATPKPSEVCGLAAYLCRHPDKARLIAENGCDNDKPLRAAWIAAIESGHTSILEHVTYTFFIDGISRACSHQLVRHRMASYTQASQRMENEPWKHSAIIPASIFEFGKQELYERTIDACHEALVELIESGVPQEDARFVLPNAWATTMMVTMNARELYHFFQLRLCMRAQWEIHELATKMHKLVVEHFPAFGLYCGPPCEHGECPEREPCKKGNDNGKESKEEANALHSGCAGVCCKT